VFKGLRTAPTSDRSRKKTTHTKEDLIEKETDAKQGEISGVKKKRCTQSTGGDGVIKKNRGGRFFEKGSTKNLEKEVMKGTGGIEGPTNAVYRDEEERTG